MLIVLYRIITNLEIVDDSEDEEEQKEGKCEASKEGEEGKSSSKKPKRKGEIKTCVLNSLRIFAHSSNNSIQSYDLPFSRPPSLLRAFYTRICLFALLFTLSSVLHLYLPFCFAHQSQGLFE